MRLLLKHIVRSILKAPLQPLLILLTVVLSVATTVTSLRMQSVISDHAEDMASVERELGDVVIGISPQARLRILFEKDAEKIVGEDGDVLGDYIFTAFYDNGTSSRAVYASGIDLKKADAYFDFTYLSGKVDAGMDLRKSVILSRSFAEENGFSVGDKIVLNLLSETKELTVRAIAKETGLLVEKDVLVSDDVLSDVLKKWIPLFSAFPNSVKIQNRIMIDVHDDAKIGDVCTQLRESEKLGDQTVTETFQSSDRDFTLYVQTMAITVLTILVVLLAVILLSTCMMLMQRQRGAEYAQFCSVGASRSVLWRLQILEAMLYAILGSVGGVLLAPLMIERAGLAFEWLDEPLFMRSQDAAVGVLLAILLLFLCTAVTLFSQRNYSLAEWLNLSGDRQKKSTRPLVIVLLVLFCAAMIAATYLFGYDNRAPFGFAAIFSIVILLYFIAPLAVCGVMRLLERLLEKRPTNGCFLLAVKNLRHHVSLHHVARLVTMILAVLLVISVCSNEMDQQSNDMKDAVTSDLVCINVSESLRSTIEAMPEVKATAGLKFVRTVVVDGINIAVGLSVTGNAQDCLSDVYCPSKLPTGNEVVLSEGVAALLNAKVGDELSIEVLGESYTFTLSEILSTSLCMVYFNAADMGILQDDLYCITLQDGCRNQENLELITATLETSGALLLEPEELFETMPHTVSGFLFLLHSSVLISVILAVIGGVNVLYSQYRARREERVLLRMMGMTRGKMLTTYALELLLLAILSTALALIFGVGMCVIVDAVARSFGLVMFI